MNQKNLNKNITGTQVEDAPKSTMQEDRNSFLSYKFEIFDDENLYSISFNAKLTGEETEKMVKMVQNCLYAKIADGIQMYLEQHSLACTNFISSRKPIEHSKAMKLAGLFLHSDTCSNSGSCLGTADICYLIADHQKWITEGCCQGCYLAVKRSFSESEGLYKFNIIGQTFNYNETNGNEYGYFAIRENKGNGLLNDIVLSAGEPVLPTFGCIDIAGLLPDIGSIQTTEQAVQLTVK